MAVDTSQISNWLKSARKSAGLTQIQASVAAGVGYGVVTNAEQGGEILASNLIALVMAYRAEDALAAQLKAWRGERRPVERPPWPNVKLPDPLDQSQKTGRRKRGA